MIDAADAIVLKYNSGSPGTTSWTEGTHGTVDHYCEFKVSSFSGGGGGSGGGGLGGSGILPVEWLDFSVRQADETVLLFWATTAELNNEGFWIERNGNPGVSGNNWERIGFVKGQDISSSINNYIFLDETPLKRDNYYRLKQVDFEGHYVYSEIRYVQIISKERNTVSVHPNPAAGHFFINIQTSNKQKGYVKLIDSLGPSNLEATVFN